jgi:uncharacterized protein (TIGR04255 family)
MTVAYHDHLPNKPLVETILEVKWGQPNMPDLAYPVIVGRLYERVKDPYRVIEDLDLAQFPPVVAVHVPRHRFRTKENGWPLVQIGPGVAVLNDTEKYTWQDFRARGLEFFLALREAHPRADELDISSLKLEYIDAFDFDFSTEDVRSFLRDKLHVTVELPEAVFQGQPVRNQPAHSLVQLAFPTSSPKGRIQLSLSTGRRAGQAAIIMQTSVLSTGSDAQEGWRDFQRWLDQAHQVIRHWFFALVQGDLLKEFLRP